MRNASALLSASLPGVANQGEESSAASTQSAGAAAVSRAAPAGLCVYRCVCLCVSALYTHTHTHTHSERGSGVASHGQCMYVFVYKICTHTNVHTRTHIQTAKEAAELLRTDTGRAGARTSVLTEAQAVEVFKLRPALRSV
jgi:hypothetical protein